MQYVDVIIFLKLSMDMACVQLMMDSKTQDQEYTMIAMRQIIGTGLPT